MTTDWDAEPYLLLMERFVRKDMSASEFEDQFNEPYLRDGTTWPDDVFMILDGVFAATDDYDEDPEYRAHTPRSMSADELRKYVGAAAARLRILVHGAES